jgi:hypothetical protein
LNDIVVEGANVMHGILGPAFLALMMASPGHGGGTPPERPTRPATGIAPPTRIPDSVNAGPTAAGEAVPIASVPRETRRAVVADAARRFNVAESSVVLTRAERVSWPDSSLGCPEPGRMYTQALVPGYRLVAKSAGAERVYHTDEQARVVSCADESRKPPREELRGKPPVEPIKDPAPPAGQR